MKKNNKFYSKVLLFGEYSVIRDSMALSTPYELFEGTLIFPKDVKLKRVDGELKALGLHIKKSLKEKTLNIDFDINSFEFDIGQGLRFQSNIPQGYGVGSSGALCAAVFDRYTKIDDELKKDIPFLKNVFSVMEAHFHGSSSGLDPLISYTNKSIIKNAEGEYDVIDLKSREGQGGLFLLNTGRTRRTEPLVNLFLEKCGRESFSDLCSDVLTPLTNRCINSFLVRDDTLFWNNFESLSKFQFDHFKPMIPTLFQELWEEGLTEKKYFLKLCGAGGGGFMLGLCKNFSDLGDELKNHEIRPLFRP